MSSFKENAKRFGHSIESLEKGNHIRTTVMAKNIKEMHSLMHDGAADDVRAKRLSSYKAEHHAELMDEKNMSIEALFMRGGAYIHADYPLCDEDTKMLDTFFPVPVDLVSIADKTISSEWNLGNSAAPVNYNLGTLTINPGGYMIATATQVTLSATSLVNNVSGNSGTNYTIGIFGVAGNAGDTGSAGGTGKAGKNGADAGTPCPGVCTGARTPAKGGTGKVGGTGGNGNSGKDGIPNLGANFKFDAITGNPIYITTTSGAGGDGGAGGAGGTGGAGGKGGDGCSSGCEGTDSADGGTGGDGGPGGDGGDGGDGINGVPISVTLGAGSHTSMVNHGGTVAAPGHAGLAGVGGIGGDGGAGGTGSGKHRSGGSQGSPGGNGASGKNGNPGQYDGQPGNITVTVE